MNTRDVDIFGYSLGGSVGEMMNPVERELPPMPSMPTMKDVRRAIRMIESPALNALGVPDEDIEWAANIGEKLYPGEGLDGRGDAARHLALGALLSRSDDPEIAKFLGDARESIDFSGGKMDKFNNRLGMQLSGTNEELEEQIVRLIESGNAEFYDLKDSVRRRGYQDGGIVELLRQRDRFEDPLERLTQPIRADLGPLQMAIPQEEGLRQRAERVLAGLMGDEREDFRRAEKALMAADVLPVLGDVGAAADVRDALSEDDLLGAGIAAISFVPVVGGMASKAFRGSADSIGPKSLDRQRGSIGVESEGGIPSLLEIEEFDPRFDPRVKEQDKLLATTARILKKDNVADKPTLALSELEGRGFVTTMSDRTAAGGRVMAINEVPLYRMVDLRGGQDFMFENPNKVWASAKKPAREILEAAQVVKKETGKDALYIPWRMSPSGGDFSTITGELMLGYASANMGKGAKKSLNSKLRKIIPDWDSVDNPDSVALWRATPDSKRKQAMKMMDVNFRDKGGLSIGAARLINTDPIQRTARDAGIQNVGRVFSDQPISKSDHPAYPFAVAGEGMGVLRRADEATVFDLLPEARLGEAQVPVKDPSKPTTEEKRSLQMKAYSGTITENILRRMEERGVNVNSFVGLAPGAIVFALTSSGVITPEEASAGGIQQFAEDVESVTDQKALSGIGSI